MDDRGISILKEIVYSGMIDESLICENLSLSKRQFAYSLEKINENLYRADLPRLTPSTSIDIVHLHRLFDFLSFYGQHYIYSEQERISLILILLIDAKTTLSLQHFSSSLYVSKNTILKDLAVLKTQLHQRGLSITFSRKLGYQITGIEYEIRKQFIEIIYGFIDSATRLGMVKRILNLEKEDLGEYAFILTKIEAINQQRFIDSRLEEMQIVLRCFVGRYLEGYKIRRQELVLGLHYTKEYQNIRTILLEKWNLEEREIAMIAMFLVSSHLSAINGELEQDHRELLTVVDTIISNFETISCIIFDDRETLHQNILQHLKPAYYRIKYDLSLSSDVGHIESLEALNNEFWIIREIVKKSSSFFADLVDREIPENEINLLTVIFGSWIRKQGSRIIGHPKVLLVSPNGISTYSLLHTMLRELFPEFIFLESITLREFELMQREDEIYDLIFSSVYLETQKHLFIVTPEMVVEHRGILRNRVLKEIYGVMYADIKIDELVEIISQFTTIKQEKNLRQALENYVSIEKNDLSLSKTPSLSTLIQSVPIQVVESVSNWEQAIHLAAKSLLEKGAITPAYVEKVIELNKKEQPYVIYGSEIAIPHAAPSDGVKALSASMLVIRKGIAFGSAMIYIFVLLAPIDKSQHLSAVLKLADLSMDGMEIEKIKQAKDSTTIVEIIEKFERS